MSQESLQSLRPLAEAFGRRDVDRALQHFAADVTVRPAVVGIDVGTLYRGGGTSRVGRVPVEWHESHVYEISAGQVSCVHEYRTRAEALEAVGISE